MPVAVELAKMERVSVALDVECVMQAVALVVLVVVEEIFGALLVRDCDLQILCCYSYVFVRFCDSQNAELFDKCLAKGQGTVTAQHSRFVPTISYRSHMLVRALGVRTESMVVGFERECRLGDRIAGRWLMVVQVPK